MGHHTAALGESDFTHGDLLRGHNLYVGGSLKLIACFVGLLTEAPSKMVT